MSYIFKVVNHLENDPFGGCSFWYGKEKKSGYLVGGALDPVEVHPEEITKAPAGVIMDIAELIEKWLKAKGIAPTSSEARENLATVGCWYDNEENRVIVDVANWFADIERAKKFAKVAKEKEIFNLSTGECIPVDPS